MFTERKLIFLKSPEVLTLEGEFPERFDFHNSEVDSLHEIDKLVGKVEAARKRLEIQNGPQTHLRELREKGVFPEGTKWAATGNSEAFFALANTLHETPATKELFDREELNIVYPAARIHLSPLEMGMQIAEKSNKTQKINFTYTEIDQESYETIEELVKIYVKNTPKLSNLRIDALEPTAKEDWDTPHLKKMRFDLKTSNGRKVELELNYEYKMSGKDYVREDIAQNADLWILHDTGTGERSLTKEESNTNIIIENYKDGDKRVFAIAENPPDGEGRTEDIYTRVGPIVGNQEGFHVGCGENHWDEEERHERDLNKDSVSKKVSLIEIDGKKIEEIRKIGGKLAIIGYNDLIGANPTQLGTYDLEVCEALLKVYELTQNDALKDELRNLAREAAISNEWLFAGKDSIKKNIDGFEAFLILLEISGATRKQLRKEAMESYN